MKIAFIGLGIMGKPMAKNLIKAGHELFVFDRNPAANEEMKAAGANICASSADTVKNVDLVITMLPNSPQVKSVMLEEDKLADAMPKTAVFIDCSSINPVASREIAAELEKRPTTARSTMLKSICKRLVNISGREKVMICRPRRPSVILSMVLRAMTSPPSIKYRSESYSYSTLSPALQALPPRFSP